MVKIGQKLSMALRVMLSAALFSLLSMTAVAELNVKEGYVRGLPPGQSTTAAFMHLLNSSDTAVTIISAVSDSAEKAEIHAHRHHNGMMSMERVQSITIPAKGEFVLAPGDHHLMLINLYKPLQEGDVVAIELMADSGVVLNLHLPVRSVLNEHKFH